MLLQHIQKNSPRLLPKPAKFEKNPPNGYRVIRKTKCGAGSSPIHKLNEEITSLKDIINEEMQFYQDLYTSKSKDERNISEGQNFFEQNRIPQLPNLEKIMCDEVVTLEEITKALKLVPNNKSPGSDGFTTNFYKFFWIDIKDFLFDSFGYSFIHRTLSNDQKLGVLNLTPKTQKDLLYLSNWRPVNLLQTDYKILTKT